MAGEGWAVVDDAGHAIIELVPTDDDRVEPNEQVAIELVNDGVEPFLVAMNGAQGVANQGVRDNDFSVIGAAVEFVGDQGVKRDLGTQELYSGPEWVDLVKKPEGAGQPPGGRDSLHDDGHKPVGYPVSYRRSNGGDDWRKAKTSVAFTVNATELPTDANTKWWIVGDDLGRAGSNSEFAKEAGVRQLADGKWEVKAENIESSFALPDTIEFYPEWKIDWRLEKRVDGRDPKAAVYGKSVNRLYITGGDATGELETVVFVGCNAAKTKSPSPEALSLILGEFSDLIVRAAYGLPLSYWLRGEMSPSSVEALVHLHNGRCEAWAQFATRVLAAQGFTSNTVALVSNVTGKPAVLVREGTAGQSNPTPPEAFGDGHAVVVVNNVLFDPSYGRSFSGETPGVQLLAWEDALLRGVCPLKEDGTPNIAEMTANDGGLQLTYLVLP